jgi:UDP-glucuronate 4-epimerase
MSHILITGVAGFIGYHLSLRLLARGDTVYGIDNLNEYYDPSLKLARLAQLQAHPKFCFEKMDITDGDAIKSLFINEKFDAAMHLAAQAGVRYSLENPQAYVEANLKGFTNVLEAARHSKLGHLVYASSSSVYGANTKLPFSESDSVDHPVSLYAASKKANELMAHSYAHLFNLNCTGLRFFTVYGPWGRPDMALFKFTKAILAGVPIDLFNNGNMVRDFTYIDDIVEGIVRIIDKPAQPDPTWNGYSPNPATSYAPYRIFNIGNSNRMTLMGYVQAIEKALGKTAKLNMLPMQPGDVPATEADVSKITQYVQFKPSTTVDVGIDAFIKWYLEYYPQPLTATSAS